uniref:Tryptophyllin-T2-2 n=1 Tax=Pithecopus azureus TaxID=2034991 RepID=TY22_PITAZ
FPPWE